VKEAFLNIVTSNQGIIHKVCSIYCDTLDDRKDLFQEIVAQLWRSYPSFRNESKVSTWMYRVSLNTAITHFKKNKRRPDQGQYDNNLMQIADDNYDETFDDQLRMLHSAIAKLSGIEKSIILLYLEDKQYEEIAEIIGITQNYVRVKMNRIKGKLKKLMGED
jgi:RNA polymerase sigma factor (sigma-70 family)